MDEVSVLLGYEAVTGQCATLKHGIVST